MNETKFNLKHLLRAYQIYAQDERLNDWDYDKLALFFVQIMGCAQSYLPAWVKQIYHQNMADYVDKLGKTGVVINKRYDTFVLGGRSLCFEAGSGFYFAAYITGCASAIPDIPREAGFDCFGRFISGTQIELKNLCEQDTSIEYKF